MRGISLPNDPNRASPATPCGCEPTAAWRWVLAVASGALICLAFPPVAKSDLIWFALAPLLLALRGATPRQGLHLGWVSGLVFWLGSLTWLWRLADNGGPLPLVIIGYAALAAYCALYFAWFGIAVAWVWRAGRLETRMWRRVAGALVLEPLLWVGSEYARGVLLSGFPWNPLGVSLHASLGLVQLASVGGVGALSVVILAVNAGIASMVQQFVAVIRPRVGVVAAPAAGRVARVLRPRSIELLLAVLLLCAVWLWGYGRVRDWIRTETQHPAWQLVLIQPNAPSIFEINEASITAVREELLLQTSLAGGVTPDLAIWPETALLGSVPYDPLAMGLASNGAEVARAPLLTGALEAEPGQGWNWQTGAHYYNASALFGTDGELKGSYRKQHLVPFGEFIPMEGLFPWLARLSPIGYSCTAGEASVVFELTPAANVKDDRTSLRFSPLICFEDIMPYLARRAVRVGARLLVNQTNDAWFEGSTEPYQHMALAVFRAVENGVPLVRAANGGVTCAIDPVGRVTRLSLDRQSTGFAGFLAVRVAVPVQPLPTLYNRYGDWLLGRPAGLLLLAVTFGLLRQPKPPSGLIRTADVG